MPGVSESSLLRYVLESAASEVMEEPITVPYGGHKQIRLPIIVDVRKGCSHTDLITHTYAGFLGNVFEPAAAQIPPKFVAAGLAGKVQVIQTIPIHISRG